ncbi:MAG TPA: nuclear transport factor 2 family protein [Bryobacteraceae bacterium]|nr:nuclear transport factor 2 family protein [Bryobacteraceae bacterium]
MTANSSTKQTELQCLGDQWAAAELRGDAAALNGLATHDFMLVGPRGFVLTKQQWLERYESGALVNDGFAWSDVQFRIHGGTAIAIGVQAQRSAYRGQPSDGRFRATQVWLDEGGWKLASVHLSPIAEGA